MAKLTLKVEEKVHDIFCERICLLYSCLNEYIYSQHTCFIPWQQNKFTQSSKKWPNSPVSKYQHSCAVALADKTIKIITEFTRN